MKYPFKTSAIKRFFSEFFLLIAVLNTNAKQNIIYVSLSGSDHSEGSKSRNCRTLAAALLKVSALHGRDVAIRLHRGT